MLISLETLIKKYDMNIRGVIHIGAYDGREFDVYERLGIKESVFFEPQPHIRPALHDKVGDRAWDIALGNFDGWANMHVARNGQSSTLLVPYKHLTQYPYITFDTVIQVRIMPLDSVLIKHEKYNFINIDVEGYEIEVFKGATNTLKNIDYIYTEVNREELRLGNAMVDQVDEFLSDFKRVETEWTAQGWGDALYIRK